MPTLVHSWGHAACRSAAGQRHRSHLQLLQRGERGAGRRDARVGRGCLGRLLHAYVRCGVHVRDVGPAPCGTLSQHSIAWSSACLLHIRRG